MARTKQSQKPSDSGLGELKKVVEGEHKRKKSKPQKKVVSTKTMKTKKHVSRLPDGRSIRKPHRWRPGTVALREIRKYQKSTDLLIKRAPFQRLIREITQYYRDDMRFTKTALNCLHLATEDYIIEIFQGANLAAIHRNRVTVMKKDLEIALALRTEPNKPYLCKPTGHKN